MASEILQAVVDSLNAGGPLPGRVLARRTYEPRAALKDLSDAVVLVCPKGREWSIESRSASNEEIQIDVALLKHLAADATPEARDAEIGGLLELVGEIAAYIRQVRIFGPAAWIHTANVPLYDPTALAERSQFISLLTVTLRAMIE